MMETPRGPVAGAVGSSRQTGRPRDPGPARSQPPLDEKAQLGQALAARVLEVSRLTAEAARVAGLSELATRRFAKPIRHVHNVATTGVAKFLMTGQGSTEKERSFIGRLGIMAASHGLSVAAVTRSYLLWRDTNLRVLNEEIGRLDTSPAIAEAARAVIRSSADTGIVRMARAYDYQTHLVARREDVVKVALHDSEAQLQVAIGDVSRKNQQLSAAMTEISEKNVQLTGVNKQQTEFVTNVSHELRTPLSGILGYAELLLAGMDGKLTDDQQRDVGEVMASGQVLLMLVNDILDESQIEAGKMLLDRTSVDLKTVVESVLGTVRTLAEGKALYLHADVQEGAHAFADERRLKQILTNLVGNAIKFTDAGGVSINCLPWSGFWRVSVADTGIGLPDDKRDLVFERFKQLDPSITRRFGGTGLGLAIAKGLVLMQGGQMGVDSVPGAGSTFWFTVPAYVPPEEARPR